MNTKIPRYSMLLMTSLISLTALAQGTTGNGGDAVVCRDSVTRKIISATLLDYYEYKYDQKSHEDLSPNQWNLDQRVQVLASHLENLDSKLYLNVSPTTNVLVNELQKTNSAVVAFTEDALVDIPDSFHLTYPEGCAVEQAAIRLDQEAKEYFGLTVDFLFQKQIWSAMDMKSRAGLIIHEAIYAYMKDVLHADNSLKTRKLNRYLHSSEYKEGSRMEHLYRAWMILKKPLSLVAFFDGMEVREVSRRNDQTYEVKTRGISNYSDEKVPHVFNSDGTWNFEKELIQISTGAASLSLQFEVYGHYPDRNNLNSEISVDENELQKSSVNIRHPEGADDIIDFPFPFSFSKKKNGVSFQNMSGRIKEKLWFEAGHVYSGRVIRIRLTSETAIFTPTKMIRARFPIWEKDFQSEGVNDPVNDSRDLPFQVDQDFDLNPTIQKIKTEYQRSQSDPNWMNQHASPLPN